MKNGFEEPAGASEASVSSPASGNIHVSESISSLLDELIDYAGLFPPAGLSMQRAVENYHSYFEGEYAWALGRFVVPVSRLPEFQQAQDALEVGRPWRLSALPGADFEADLQAVQDFNLQSEVWATIDAIEAKVTGEQDAERKARLVPRGVAAYFEVPASASLDLLRSIRDTGARAKIRTGGVTQDVFPTTESLAQFLSNCAVTRTPFKATAGLHHPVRCLKPLTYEPDAPSGIMHGFLNVFLAAVLAYSPESLDGPDEMPLGAIQTILNNSDPARFHFTDEAVHFDCEYVSGDGQQHRIEGALSSDNIRTTRREFAVSFGSCSFEEPLQDLRSFKFL